METKNLALTILGIVVIVALISLVLLFKVQKEAAVTYQQLIHRDYAVLADYSFCDDGPCGKSAIWIGDDSFTGNAICQCPDGKIFQTDKRRVY
ncbi:MAG: hypothetical protein QW666_00465 [Candidatus Woesearchaeota archaeon]